MDANQESPYRIEPTQLVDVSGELLDLLAQLPAAAGRLGARLHPATAASLAALVRVINCYYSNLIEGHNTRPKDIERALVDDFDADGQRRSLQLEALAHIRIQARIDSDAADGALGDPAHIDFIQKLHLDFYKDAPESMILIKGSGRNFMMVPGEMRNKPEQDVTVGRHIPPSSVMVTRFMQRFAECYSLNNLRPAQRVLALPAAHHRFNFIHPFLDGNGRVSRLMSHAMAYHAGIGSHGLWSISRGLARGLKDRSEYKFMMDHADTPRQGDLDGRGNLSTQALVDYSTWFLKVCLDQILFMESLFDIDTLSGRLRRYVNLKNFRPEATKLLTEVLHRGEIARGDASIITGLKERTARDLLGSLLRDGILGTESEKGAVGLRFPVDTREILFPRLFGESE
jgi:Fic family protein